MRPALALLFVVFLTPQSSAAEDGHPFILWTPSEAAAIRRTVEQEPWAGEQYAAAAQEKRSRDDLFDLFRFSVMGDKDAGEKEKKLLLDSIRDGKVKGNYIMPLRYDILYSVLTGDERKRVEKAFRDYIDMAMTSIADRSYNRFNWLPNLGYPWYLSAHLMAASMRDRELAQEIFESPFGLKWYFDEYLSDCGFYNEEFGKMYNTPDAILLWCRACERLGLDEIGYEYRGRQGATAFGHIESVLRIGMPSVDMGTSRRRYPRLSMGDAKGARGTPAYGFQHYLIAGWLEHRYAGKPYSRWKLGEWCWFELAHQKWPDAGFGYFLAQRRAPNDDHYYPSLLFGLDPIDPQSVTPPSAPSGVYPGRGLVVLRAEEGPEYWESAAPAVGMRLATPYAHHVQDCFSLTGFYAFNRPLYVNRKHATNYSGVDPGWSNSARSHSTVIVDFQEPKTIGPVDVRHDFSEHAKFVVARGQGIYDDVNQTRALVLTDDYLVDVFQLKSDTPRHYQWTIQAVGNVFPEPNGKQAWAPSLDLQGYQSDCANEKSLATEEDWSVTVLQSSGGANRRFSGLGERWFEERIGSRITMFAEQGTTAYAAWAPTVTDTSGMWRGRDRFCHGEDEPAGATIVAVRKRRDTTFVAIHEPFKGHRRVDARRLSTSSDDAVAIRLVVYEPDKETPRVDYVVIDLRADQREYVIIQGLHKPWRCRGFALAQSTESRFHMHGDVQGLEPEESLQQVVIKQSVSPDDCGRVAIRWLPESALCLPTGGAATRRIRVTNVDRSATGSLQLTASDGLRIEPKEIFLRSMVEGEETEFEVRVSGEPSSANKLGNLRVQGAEGLKTHPVVLPVAHGVCTRRDMHRPADFSETIYSPRYIAKAYYMASGATSLLLDPLGYRRSDSSGASYPQLVRFGVDERGREGWQAENVRKFPYFVPVVIPAEGDKHAYVYEAGWHAHGSRSAVEHRFTEDWIVVRFREAAPAERIAFSWLPESRKNDLQTTILGRDAQLAAEKAPGKVLVATPDDKYHDGGDPDNWPKRANLPREVDEITAVFHRPHGYEYGSAMLYPPGSKREGNYVTQPGDAPMAFTYCTEREFLELVNRWKKTAVPEEATDQERSIYGAAFMPHLE